MTMTAMMTMAAMMTMTAMTWPIIVMTMITWNQAYNFGIGVAGPRARPPGPRPAPSSYAAVGVS